MTVPSTDSLCTGKALPSISSTGQLPKYSEKSVVSMVADISTTRSWGYACTMSRRITSRKSDYTHQHPKIIVSPKY